jgi:hypothetical protein
MSKQPSPNMLEGGNSNTVTKVGGDSCPQVWCMGRRLFMSYFDF